ncbi:MAG: hypothetical protein WCF18_19295 [Chthoniobacteraceae bacterium]
MDQPLAANRNLSVSVFATQWIKRPASGLCIGLERQIVALLVALHTLTCSAALFALGDGWIQIGRGTVARPVI